MDKNKLVKYVAFNMSISLQEAQEIVALFLRTLEDGLCEDGKITLNNLGTFSLWEQTARPGRNPRTGDTCMIKPRTSVKFRPSENLLEKLNKKKK